MGRKRKTGNDIDGWIIIDKPTGIGSTPVVGKVRRGMHANKVGHAGTLDPFATGVLPIALGLATKTIPFVQDADKQYVMSLQFGMSTDTFDCDGTEISTHPYRPTVGEILTHISDFIGHIEQTPPAYSAIKINGKRAYNLARAGKQVIIPSRTVRIDNIILLSIHTPDGITHTIDTWDMCHICDSVVMQVDCGKGTYIRTLGQDMALKCGTVGYLTALRRTKVGIFSQNNALSLANFEKMIDNKTCTDNILLSVESSLVGIPVVTVTEDEAFKFQTGIKLLCPVNVDIPRHVPLVIATTNIICGLATTDGNRIISTRVFYKPVPRRKL